MLRFAKSTARLLPRHIKDKLPGRLKQAYQAKVRQAQRFTLSEMETLEATLHSLKTVPMAQYLRQDAASSSEYHELAHDVAAIEINDSCNLDCVMCKTSEATRKKALMDLGLFEELVANLKDLGFRTTNFHTIGDPTANKNLGKYLAILRRYGLKISHLSSNCQMLDRHLDTIFEYRDVIHEFRASVDAASKDVYERIRINGKWETLLENLIAFAERNQSAPNPIPVTFSNVITKMNFHELAFIPSTFSFVAKPTCHSFGLVKATGPAVPYFMQNSYFEKEYLPTSPCRIFWGSPVILKDGQVAACCVDYDGSTVFAHVKDGPITQSYNNEKIRGFRKAHLEGRAEDMPALCQNCYLADPRYARIISGTIQRFYAKVRKHPVYLQRALNRIGPLLKAHDFDGVKAVIESL